MPPQQKKSELMAKYGAKLAQAAAQHADAPFEHGFRRLPGGITNGIARLTRITFEKFKSDTSQKQADGSSAVGEFYMRAEGSVEEPAEAPDGTPIIGMITSVMVPLCAKGIKWGKGVLDFSDCVKRAQNVLKGLGGPEMDYTDIEAAAEALVEVAPRFAFHTDLVKAKQEGQEDRVFETWDGIENVDQDVSHDAASGTEDNTSGDEGDTEATDTEATESEGEDTPADVDGAVSEIAEETDADKLAELAGDPAVVEVAKGSVEYAARERLTNLALEAGVSQDAVDSAEDWATLAGLLKEATAPKEPPTPTKGSKWKYKGNTVEILSVVARTKTVTVKGKDGKTINGKDKKPLAIKWSELTPA